MHARLDHRGRGLCEVRLVEQPRAAVVVTERRVDDRIAVRRLAAHEEPFGQQRIAAVRREPVTHVVVVAVLEHTTDERVVECGLCPRTHVRGIDAWRGLDTRHVDLVFGVLGEVDVADEHERRRDARFDDEPWLQLDFFNLGGEPRANVRMIRILGVPRRTQQTGTDRRTDEYLRPLARPSVRRDRTPLQLAGPLP